VVKALTSFSFFTLLTYTFNLNLKLNAMKVSTAIQKEKSKLINKAKKDGIHENFGQKEVRKLKNKYGFSELAYDSKEERQEALKIESFDNWCMNFDLSNI